MITVEQCKQIVQQCLSASGRGGFLTGIVTSISPLTISVGDRLSLTAADLYVAESCIGLSVNLKHRHGEDATQNLKDNVILRKPLQVDDGVLLLSRPSAVDGTKYILLDRIQPYTAIREVNA